MHRRTLLGGLAALPFAAVPFAAPAALASCAVPAMPALAASSAFDPPTTGAATCAGTGRRPRLRLPRPLVLVHQRGKGRPRRVDEEHAQGRVARA